MAKQNNNRFRLLCIGVGAFTAVAAIIFSALGGGEGISNENSEIVEGFNSELPSANVESVSDDRVKAARLADERRKKEEMLGMTGTHFNLLEIEEKKKSEKDIDSMAKELEEQTKAELEKQVNIQESNNGVVYNTPTFSNGEDHARRRQERRSQAYKDAQDIFGKDVLPDKEEEKPVAKAEPVQEVKAAEAPKKKSGFNTMNKKNNFGSTNSIKAVFHGSQTNLTTNSTVKLRLLEPLVVGDVTIPKQSFVYGKVSFGNARVLIKIDNIIYQNNVVPFKGEIYDLEGMQGIYVPDNAVNDAVKEAGEGAVNETPAIANNGRSATGYAINLLNRGGAAIKNAVVKSVGKNKVSISDNYLVYIRTVEK